NERRKNLGRSRQEFLMLFRPSRQQHIRCHVAWSVGLVRSKPKESKCKISRIEPLRLQTELQDLRLALQRNIPQRDRNGSRSSDNDQIIERLDGPRPFESHFAAFPHRAKTGAAIERLLQFLQRPIELSIHARTKSNDRAAG